MLSAAHVLAMDSKNLLDVVDAIRLRYPHLNQKIYAPVNVQTVQQSAMVEEDQRSTVNYPQHVPTSPTPVSCTFVQYPMYSQTVQQTNSSNGSSSVNAGQIIDS